MKNNQCKNCVAEVSCSVNCELQLRALAIIILMEI